MSFPWMPRSRRRAASRLVSAKSRERGSRVRRRLSLDALEDRTLLSTSIPLNSVAWTQMGPAPITNTSGAGGTGSSTGRVSGLAADPTNANTLYLSAAGGGVWKSTNAGTSWSAKTDTQAVTFMGSIAVAPSNPQVIYAGTGEANNSGDSFYGKGVLKSIDGGSTWTLTGSTVLGGLSIAHIAVSATSPNVLYVAATSFGVNNITTNASGIYKSTDGGTTWTNTTATLPKGTNYSLDQWTDVVVDPTNANVAYAANGLFVGDTQNGVYKTTNGGTSWSIAGNYPKGSANGQITLAIAKSNPSIVVASVSNPATDGLKYIQKTTDGGVTWTALASAPDYLGGGNGSGQGWYDNVIAIDPTNPQVIFAAGVVTYGNPDKFGIVESRDGGTSWFDITIDKNGIEPHTDSHAMTFDANGKLLIGNDGGVWRLENPLQASLSWANLNANLAITQFTGAALDPTNADVIYGGTQDNGTNRFNDNQAWRQVFGGDGGYVKVDPVTTNVVYTENFGVSLRRSTDGGNTWQTVVSGINQNDPTNFYVYYTIDPNNHNRLLYGTNRIYVSNNQGTSWSPITTPNQSGWATTATINWITVAPSDSNTIYATTSDGHIWVSTNGGTTWTQRDVAAAKDTFQQIVVDPANAQTAYIVRNAFNDATNTGHVFKTTNGGATWTNISGSLPDVPAWSFAIDTRGAVNRMYVGTDTGVYAATIGTTTWAAYKTGLPNAQVVSLEVAPNIDVLMAATHGRGVWEISSTDQLSVIGVAPAPGTEGQALANIMVAMFNDVPTLGPIGNYTATIDWGDGSGFTNGAITNLGNGFYGVSGDHTYTDHGTYQIRVTVSGTNGHAGAGAVAFTVNDAPLTPLPLTFATVVGAAFSGVAGSFHDGNPFSSVSEFTATIDWGNGNKTTGTVVQTAPGEFDVKGSTTYRTAGTYNVTITVKDVGGSSTTVASTAQVNDAPIDPLPKTVQATEGVLFSGVLGSLTTPNQFASVSDYKTVTVSWGDGTPNGTLGTGITIVNQGGGLFDIRGSHTYARFGDYALTVTVVTVGNTTIVIPSTAHVVDAALTVTVNSQSTVEGGTVTGIIGTIVDANPNGTAVDLLGGSTINWGDGSAAQVIQAAQLVSLGNGRFNVLGTHTYGEEGSKTLTINAVSVGGSTGPGTGLVTVQDAPIHSVSASVSGTAGQPVSTSIAAPIASFSDEYAAAPVTDHSASIDWGDGTITPGRVVQPGGVGTTFFVIGGTIATPGHIYARAGSYVVNVTITDIGGATDTVASQAVVADAPITIPSPQPTIPSIKEGESYGGTIATFGNGNIYSVPSDFIVTIDWGDGTQTLGQVQPILNPITSQPTGSFSVLSGGNHMYPEVGAFSISTQVISLGGSRNTAFNSIQVVEPPIVPVATTPLSGVAGATVSGVAAIFSEYAQAPITDFVATIDWGDGTTADAGTIAKTSDGNFTVSGSHTYATFGTFVTRITVQDVDDPGVVNPPVTLSGQALISDAGLSGSSAPVAAVAGFVFSGEVATFSTPNALAAANEFRATITWGDGTSPTTGLVTGGNGNFLVSGTHTYATPATSLPVSVVITHYNPSNVAGNSITLTDGTAHILVPVSGQMSQASDSGVSNSDGITRITTPVFTGHGEPGAVVHILAAAAGSGGAGADVGSVNIDAAGNWTVQISPLGDGSYVFHVQMVDSVTGLAVQTAGLPVTPAGGTTLLIDTAGPTVAGIQFSPRNGQIVLVLNDALAGLDPAGVSTQGNYQLARPSGAALVPYGLRSLVVTPGAAGQQVVTLGFNLGARVRTGVYVVTLNARGLTDLAGNILHETTLVEFPQTSNVPNPNYIAQFNVATNQTASGPKPYISIPEQLAAANYSGFAQSRKVVRVPPRPTAFPRRRGG